MTERQFTILVVDDNDLNRTTWAAYLEGEGFRVVEAADGVEALRTVRREPVDLVLLDVMMPVMDGFEVLRLLRKRHTADDLPVIMVTAKNQTQDVVRGFDTGASDYLTKPVDLPVMLVRIRAQLRGRQPASPRPLEGHGKSILEIEPGTVLDEKYRLEALLGYGHYGAVYRATHLALGRPVAVKLLHTRFRAEAEALERFQREGISACRIDHPNVVSVLDLSVSGGQPYLVMELLEGHSLEEEIRRGPLPPVRCAVVLLPVCEVLAEAHAMGVIHRDVKPQNIFLQQARRGEIVKVLDFGIARLLGDSLDPDLSLEGSGPGTPAYMAPERFSGSAYDGHADVYSLGVTLYEMLTGRPPFVVPDGNPIKLALMHQSAEPPPLCELNPEIPRPIEALVLRTLDKRPENRPAAGELARRFVAALGLELPESFRRAFDVLAPTGKIQW